MDISPVLPTPPARALAALKTRSSPKLNYSWSSWRLGIQERIELWDYDSPMRCVSMR